MPLDLAGAATPQIEERRRLAAPGNNKHVSKTPTVTRLTRAHLPRGTNVRDVAHLSSTATTRPLAADALILLRR